MGIFNLFRKKKEKSMSSQSDNPTTVLTVLIETCSVIKAALRDNDDDKAHEAVTVMLMQAMTMLGVESPVMGHLFPAMDAIKRRIDSEDLAGALKQTEIFEVQLHEIVDMISAK